MSSISYSYCLCSLSLGIHFYIPYRVFERIEKVIRKYDTIVSPLENKEIFDTFGTVKSIGGDVAVLNWKDSIQTVLRGTGQLHFKFAPSKRLHLKKRDRMNGQEDILVKGEVHYRIDTAEYR
ncbi:hypothetical protein PR048_004342 [Dryococelus australis]|uniref:Uncharacterized protein n=1 Tax=Dryococelus australis TaxID=614101 RepID=A0ABQ9I6B2_9NEOP|nr:hypothetical protein PR048_004342 [Dryococelus australis]